MDEKALEIVRNYIIEHLDKSDVVPEFETLVICKHERLPYWEIASTIMDDYKLYEVFYNIYRNECELTVYDKVDHMVIREG